jgi:MFS family permease
MQSASPFRALSHRSYRLYFAGQGVSLVGTWAQQVAASWLVYQMTESPAWLGLVTFAGQAPALLIAPPAGALIDRSDRRRVVLLTQGLALAQALVLATLALTGTIAVWHLLTLSVLLGVVNAVDMPARQALLAEMVGRTEDLANAIALNSSAFNTARLVGPALAALLLAWTSPGVCFLANALSYLAVLAALLAMPLTSRRHTPAGGPLLHGLREGLSYAWGQAPIRSVLLLVALVGTAATACSTLLPVLATALPGGDASTLGVLTAAGGVGALAGAGFLASRRGLAGLGRLLATAPALFGLGMLALSFSGWLWTSAALLAGTGCALVLVNASCNTVLQALVEEGKRGRLMSLFTAAVTGAAPVGGLLAGIVADRAGAPAALQLGGLACLLATVAFAVRLRRLDLSARPLARAHVVAVRALPASPGGAPRALAEPAAGAPR